MSTWNCAGCYATNDEAVTACELCGMARPIVYQGLTIPASTTTRPCGHCHKQRPVEKAGDPATYPCPLCGSLSSWFCHLCGWRAPGAILLDGVQRCTSCHLEYLAYRAKGHTDASPCTEPGCTKTLGEHREEFMKIADRALVKWGTKR